MTSRWKTRLLAATVVFLALFPIFIFAADATERGPLVTMRNAAMQRAGARQMPDSLRRARQRAQRQRIRPTLTTAALGMVLQLFWVVMIGLVGRKYFGLRL